MQGQKRDGQWEGSCDEEKGRQDRQGDEGRMPEMRHPDVPHIALKEIGLFLSI